jgi:3-oxoadipate enol-lactonase
MRREDRVPFISFPLLAQSSDLVRFDARGHGDSSATPDLGSYHWHELARDELALAGELGITSFVAAGASMGAGTALHVAALAPESVIALLLVIPPTAWETRAARQGIYESAARLVEEGERERLIRRAGRAPLPDPVSGSLDWHEGFAEVVRSTDPAVLARLLRGATVSDFPSDSELRKLRMPALILGWTGDPGHPVSTAERLAETLPNADLKIASNYEEWQEWGPIAARFIVRSSSSPE